jgi:hypothetical protein
LPKKGSPIYRRWGRFIGSHLKPNLDHSTLWD